MLLEDIKPIFKRTDSDQLTSASTFKHVDGRSVYDPSSSPIRTRVNWKTEAQPNLFDDAELHAIFGMTADREKHKHYDTVERVLSRVEPIDKPILSYRGMKMKQGWISAAIKKIESGKSIQFKLTHPTFLTNAASIAWDFAKPAGYRDDVQGQPVVLELVIRPGVRVIAVDTHLNMGAQHIISRDSKITLTHAKKYRKGYVLGGEVTAS